MLVTGANTGIGRATATELARRGARVHVACRSYERARPVLDDIATAHGADAVSFLALDLADLASVRAGAGAYIASGEPLHVLVNNAGVAGQRGMTTDGFELAFGINHLGHFLFTTMLLEVLGRSAPARVVVVASDSHYGAKGIDFEAVRRPTRSVTGLREYGVSKLCNVLFAQELSRRVGATDAAAFPGAEGAGVTTSCPAPRGDRVRHLATPAVAARAAGQAVHEAHRRGGAHAGVLRHGSRRRRPLGALLRRVRAARPPSQWATAELGAELWERSEAWTRPSGGG